MSNQPRCPLNVHADLKASLDGRPVIIKGNGKTITVRFKSLKELPFIAGLVVKSGSVKRSIEKFHALGKETGIRIRFVFGKTVVGFLGHKTDSHFLLKLAGVRID